MRSRTQWLSLLFIAGGFLAGQACSGSSSSTRPDGPDALGGMAGGQAGAPGGGGQGGADAAAPGGRGGAGGADAGGGAVADTGGGGGRAGTGGGGGGQGGTTNAVDGSAGDSGPALPRPCTKHADCRADELCIGQVQCGVGTYCERTPQACLDKRERSCGCSAIAATCGQATCVDRTAGCIVCTLPP